MSKLRTDLQRIWNGGRKALAGLTLHGENVWPGVHNDLFVAHLSIYSFFSRFSRDQRVLDAGCGTGYGSLYLLNQGEAREVTGVDLDPGNIRYAQRHCSHPRAHFMVGDCERLSGLLSPESRDLIVVSNVLEHLRQPERFLSAAASILTKSGRLVVALPPIVNEGQKSDNDAIPYHRSNLYVDEWIELFGRFSKTLTIYRQCWSPAVKEPDFASPFRSRLAIESFEFHETDRDELYQRPSLGIVYELEACGVRLDRGR